MKANDLIMLNEKLKAEYVKTVALKDWLFPKQPRVLHDGIPEPKGLIVYELTDVIGEDDA